MLRRIPPARLPVLACALASFAMSAPARAQAPAPGGAPAAARPDSVLPPKTPSIGAGKDGFTLKSGDGAYKLKVTGYMHIDGRYFLDTRPAGAVSTMSLRRVRPSVEGTVTGRYSFRLMPDFGNGQVVLYDAYLDIQFAPSLAFRAGKFKPPVGIERLLSATALPCAASTPARSPRPICPR